MNNRTIQAAVATLLLIEEAVTKQWGHATDSTFQKRVDQVIALGTADMQQRSLDGIDGSIYGLRNP